MEQILKARGVQAFLPTEVKWRRISRHKKTQVHYPLLPRYVFVTGADPWHVFRALHGRGVQGVVAFSGSPAAIRDEAVQRLAAIAGGMVQTRQQIHRAFIPGDRVVISRGPFKDWLVPIESISGESAKILMTMFGAVQEVKVPLAHLEAA